MDILLQDSTFRKFREFIYEASGIFIPDTKKYLIESRLIRRIQTGNFSSYEDYLNFITSNSNVGERSKLFDCITTNETYFFREPQQLEVFVNDVAPKVLEQKKTKEIKLWSAACSTGEEPYNLVMLLRERTAGVRMEVTGSDISENVLESAKKGVFSSYSVRNIPELYMKKYFRVNGQMTFELDNSIRSSVSFSNINLVDEKKMRTVRGVDVIFCRNVLIYFDDKAKQKAVSYLYDSLRPGGYLFVGSSESLHSVTRAFRPVIFNKVVVYQKG